MATMEEIVSFCKQRGFVYPSSEIYGGFRSVYDYGPLGHLLLSNIKQLWQTEMVQKHRNIAALDGAIFTNPKVWEASGHTESFSDPLVECEECHTRHRADHLIEEALDISADGISLEDIDKKIAEHQIACPKCGSKELAEAKTFNLLVKAYLGVTEDSKSACYLRGETCQTIYLNYANVMSSMRYKIPFGIAQIGKAFRNEITPGNFVFRTREFEQMEMQYFVDPRDGAKVTEIYEEWREKRMAWHKNVIGLKTENLRWRQHNDDERAHYARDAWDIEFNFPIGFKELEGVHDRGDWDLSRHSEYSGQKLDYFDEASGERYTPFVVETSVGATRLFLATLVNAYEVEELENGESRVVLRLKPGLAPIKVAILPLSKKPELSGAVDQVWEKLNNKYMTMVDVTGSIGKRYRRQDEIGTPYCITVDFDTLEDGAVTIRDRDTMTQERIKIEEVEEWLGEKLAF